jgi:hypothetical protein
MTTIVDYRYLVPVTKRNMRQRDGTSTHLVVLSLWAVAGLALTGLTFVLGFGAEVVRALGASG